MKGNVYVILDILAMLVINRRGVPMIAHFRDLVITMSAPAIQDLWVKTAQFQCVPISVLGMGFAMMTELASVVLGTRVMIAPFSLVLQIARSEESV